ncbi:MAG: hypothetical protein N3A54_05880 [Patescibacteria group bacterium]|nr:hypothetical protein [Patescibacteria group bacterium]
MKNILSDIAKMHLKKEKFIPGKMYIPVTQKVFDEEELINGMKAVLDGWWTEGRLGTI